MYRKLAGEEDLVVSEGGGSSTAAAQTKDGAEAACAVLSCLGDGESC